MGLLQSQRTGQHYYVPDPGEEDDFGNLPTGERVTRSRSSGNYYAVPSFGYDLPELRVVPQQTLDPVEESVQLADYAKSVMQGGAAVGQGIGWLLRVTGMPGVEELGGAVEELGANAVDYWHGNLSEAAQRELAREFVHKNESGEYEWGDASLNTVGLLGAQSLLGTAAGGGIGGGVTKVLQVFANPVGRGVLIRAAQAGSQQALKKLGLVDKVIGAAGFGLGEGTIGAATAGTSVYQRVMKMAPEEITKNQRYQEVFASTDDSLPWLERHQYAAETIAREASTQAGLQSGLTTALLGAPLGAYFGSLFGRTALGKIANMARGRQALIGGAGEAAQEAAQGAAEATISNVALQEAGVSTGTFDDVLNQMIGGAAAGAPLGAAIGGAQKPRRVESQPTLTEDQLAAARTPAAPLALPAPPAAPDYIGTPEGELLKPGQERPGRRALPAPRPSDTYEVGPDGQARRLTESEVAVLDERRRERAELGGGPTRVPVTAASIKPAEGEVTVRARSQQSPPLTPASQTRLRKVATEARAAGVPPEDVLNTVRSAVEGKTPILQTTKKLQNLIELAKPSETKPAKAETKAVQRGTIAGRAVEPGPIAEPIAGAAPALPAEAPAAPLGAAPSKAPAVGKPQPIKAGAMTVETGYRVYELRDLIASHTLEGKPRAEYPQTRQPRDRSRPATKQWLQEAAASFRPETLLTPSNTPSGTPVVDRNRVVGSGNGRVLLLQAVHAQGKGQQYTDLLKARAAEFGLTPESVERFDQPVLVREETAPLSEEQEVAFGREANKPGMAAFSPSEQARIDADTMTEADLQRFAPSAEGDVLAASNDQFVRAFLGRMPAAERGGMLTAEGRPTKQLADRVRLAIFQRAYQDPRILNLVAEEADPEFRTVLNALTAAAPAFAKARGIDPTLGGYNVPEALVEALNTLRAAKAKGQALDEYLNQQSMFDQRSPLAERMARFLSTNMRSGRRMADALTQLGQSIERALAGRGTADIFGGAPPTLDQLIDSVNRQGAGGAPQQAAAQPALFSRPAGQTVTDEVPDQELYGGDPNAQPSSPDAADFGRPPAPASAERSAIPQNIPQRVKAQLLASMAEANRPIAETMMARVMNAIGGRGRYAISTKSEKSLLGKANRPGVLAKRPWWNVEYVADSFRFKAVLNDFQDLGAAMEAINEVARELGVEVVKADFSKFWSARGLGTEPRITPDVIDSLPPVDLSGWRMVPIDLRMPNGQLAEFYMTMRELDDAQDGAGHDLFERWRYREQLHVIGNGEAIREAFLHDMRLSRDLYDGAARAYLTRTDQSESALLASVSNVETWAASVMGAKLFVNSSIVPRSVKSEDQTPAAERQAASSGAITTTSPEPSRAVSATGFSRSIGTPSAGTIPRTQSVAQLRRSNVPLDRVGQTPAQLRAAIGAALTGVSPYVNTEIFATAREAQARFPDAGIPADAHAFFIPGTRNVGFIAENVEPGREQMIFAHEVFGHMAVEQLPEFQAAIGGIQSAVFAKQRGMTGLWNEVARRQPSLDNTSHAKEVIALVAERGLRVPWFGKLMGQLRTTLRTMGFTLDWTESDLRALIARGTRQLQARVDATRQRALALLNPFSSEADILAGIEAAAGQADADGAIDGTLFSRAAPASPGLQAVMDKVLAPDVGAMSIRDRARRLWTQLTGIEGLAVKQGLIDQFASIEVLEREVSEGKLLDAAESAYKSALATKNLSSVMAAVMLKGVPTYTNGVYQPTAMRKGIVEIFKPIVEHKDGNLLRQWEVYAAANRAQRLLKEGREKLFTQADIDVALRLGEQYPEFKTALREWTTFNSQLLDLAEAAGVIDPEMRKLWVEHDYVPFYRTMEEVTQGPGRKSSLEGQRARIKRLKGSEEQVNVFENMMLNTAHLLDAAYKNRAMQKIAAIGEGVVMTHVPLDWEAVSLPDATLAAALRAAGIDVEKMNKAQREHYSKLFRRVAPRGQNIVSVMRTGKPVYYEVTDPLVLRALAGMGHDNFADVFGLFRGSKRLLTTAVTIDPAFMLANWVRDTLSTWVVSDASMKPVIDAVKGLRATWGEDPVLMQMMMAGAGGGGFYDSNPEDIRKLIEKRLPATKVKGFMDSIVSPRRVWEVWRKIGASAENANRVAVFRAVLANGGTVAEAAYQARDVLNFTMRGDFAAMRWLTETVPFLNARVQGLYRLYRGARDNRMGFMLKGMTLLAATMALALKNSDEPEYEELPEWDKDLYWHLFAGGEHYRIPKPFEVGAMFATLPERAYRTLSGRDSGKLLWSRVFQMAADTFAFNPIPQAVKPLIEQYANRSMFTGSPIVGMAELNLQPEAQFTPWTSETMRELAQALPDWAPEWMRSPRRLEAALRGYTGATGIYALSLSDAFVRQAAGYPDVPSRKIYDYPVVARFWKDPNPRHTKYADQLYEMLDEANAVFSTVNRFRREQRFEEAAVLQKENVGKLAARRRLNNIGTTVRKLNNQIRLVQLNRTMDAATKRTRIDQLVERKNTVLRGVAPLADLF